MMSAKIEDLTASEKLQILKAEEARALADAIRETGGNQSVAPDNPPAPRRPLAG